MFFQVNSSTFPNIGLFLNYFVRESVNFISLISTGSVGIEKDLICTDPQKLDRKNLTFGVRFNHRPFHLWLGMSNPPNWIFLLTHLFPFSNFRGQVKKVPRTVALSGFRGQVKKPDCSGLDLCVVAISSLYALQAMRLVGGLTGVRRRNQRFLTYRLII